MGYMGRNSFFVEGTLGNSSYVFYFNNTSKGLLLQQKENIALITHNNNRDPAGIYLVKLNNVKYEACDLLQRDNIDSVLAPIFTTAGHVDSHEIIRSIIKGTEVDVSKVEDDVVRTVLKTTQFGWKMLRKVEEHVQTRYQKLYDVVRDWNTGSYHQRIGVLPSTLATTEDIMNSFDLS